MSMISVKTSLDPADPDNLPDVYYIILDRYAGSVVLEGDV